MPIPRTRDALVEAVLTNVAEIQGHIKRSGHIKGTVWGAINDAS